MSKKLSKTLCLSLSALTLTLPSTSAYKVSENTSTIAKTTQNKSEFSDDIKGKIAQKIQNLQDTIKEHPITSATVASSLVFYGLYKSVVDPQLKSLKEKNNALNNRLQSVEDVRRRLEAYIFTANCQLSTLRESNQNSIRQITQLSDQLQNYIREHGAQNNLLTTRLNELVNNVRNLQNNGDLRHRFVRNYLSQLNDQIESIIREIRNSGIAPAREYRHALSLNFGQSCALGDENGSVYLKNYITNMTVNINNSNDIGNKLSALCRQFNITSGMQVDDRQTGWTQSATEYFFTDQRRYFQISEYHKTILAQCIEAMYENRDNNGWSGIIEATLMSLSSHGGHCSWRAEALVNTAYDNLYRFLSENSIGHENQNAGPQNQIEFLINNTFTNLKNKILDSAKVKFLNDYRRVAEPLLDCNYMLSYLRYLLGITQQYSSNDRGQEYALNYLKDFMDKKYLIEQSHQIIDRCLNENDQRVITDNSDQENISFENYCKFSGKTHEQIERTIQKISEYNGDDANYWQGWANGEHEAFLANAISFMGDLYNWEPGPGPDSDIFEIDNHLGFKFIIICFNNGYFKEIN